MEKVITGAVHLQFPVGETSQIGSLRRAVNELSLANRMSSQELARAEVVVTELGTNLVKYANGTGEVLIGFTTTCDYAGLEIIAIDQGPGMSDIQRMLQDGVSTGNSLGGGMGAIMRMSDEFDIHSEVGRGTAILSRIWKTNQGSSQPSRTNGLIGGITVPLTGEKVSGDLWAMHRTGDTTTIALFDGLGHGPQAESAAKEAVRIFDENSSAAPKACLAKIHEALRSTQGAAGAIAELKEAEGTLTYSGVGNISGKIYGPNDAKGCVSLAGGLGFQLPKLQEFSYIMADQSLLIMNSDGLKSSINAANLADKHAVLIAAILYRDYRRKTDDASIVVVKSRGK